MAPLTWRNVDGPDFSAAGRLLNDAVGNFAGGLNGVGDNISTLRGTQKSNRSATATDILAGVANAKQVDPALERISAQINSSDMTPELQAAMLALRGRGLGYDKTNAETRGINARTGKTNADNARLSAKQAREFAEQDEAGALASEIARIREQANTAGGGYLAPEGTGIAPLPGGVVGGEALLPGSPQSVNPDTRPDRISQLLANANGGEGTRLLSPERVNDLINGNVETFNTQRVAEDADRGRDDTFDQTLEGRDRATRVEELAYQVAGTATNQQDIPRLVADMDIPAQDKTAVLARLTGEGAIDVAGIQTAPNDPNAAPLPGVATAEVALQQFESEQNQALARNQGVRIKTNATSTYATPDPASTLADQALTDDSPGQVQAAMNRVAKEAGVSPAEAAAALAETVGRGRRFVPFDGQDGSQTRFDPDEAIALLGNLGSVESQRAANEVETLGNQNKAGAESIRGEIEDLSRQVRLQESRGNASEAAALRKTLAQKVDAATNIYANNPIVGGQAAAPAAAGSPAQAAIQNEAQAVQNAALEIVSGVTGIAPGELAQLDAQQMNTVVQQLLARVSTLPRTDETRIQAEQAAQVLSGGN